MNSKLGWLATLLIVSAGVSSAWAQGGRSGQSGFGGSGFGGTSSGFGSSGLGGGFGSSGFGSSGLGSSGFGSGGFGQSGFGGGGFGSSGLGGSGFGTSGQGGSGFGQNSFGNNQQGGQDFVGRDSSDMASVFNQLGRNSNQFFQQLNRSMGGNRNRRSNSQEDNAALLVRVRLDVAFDHPAVQPTVVAAAVRDRLETVLARRSITAPEVEMVGDTVVLRGIAPSESQRLVIEKLVSLEPGVGEIDNQMTVNSEPSANERSATEPSSSPPLPPQADR
jgi:BON domain